MLALVNGGGTFNSDIPGTFESDMGGTFKVLQSSNDTWSIDFVSDRLQSGRTFRVLNIIDDCGRVAVGQEISMSMPAERVIKLLEKVIWLNGKPKNIRCDNGPEFISEVLSSYFLLHNLML